MTEYGYIDELRREYESACERIGIPFDDIYNALAEIGMVNRFDHFVDGLKELWARHGASGVILFDYQIPHTTWMDIGAEDWERFARVIQRD